MTKKVLFNNRYASRIYRKALGTIWEHGYIIKPWDELRAATHFALKIINLPTRSNSQMYLNSLIVHEAHHVSTSHERMLIAESNKTTKEIFDWCINDEIQAYTKQYRFLSYFNPMYRTLAPVLIRASLRYYLNFECRDMEEDAKRVRNLKKLDPYRFKLQALYEYKTITSFKHDRLHDYVT